MKKLFLFAAAVMTAISMSAAYTLNNPVGEDGRYIVKWDCENNTFAASNDMELDESFVFAIDVTGTWLETWLQGTPTAAGASRGLAINKWTSKGDVNGDTNRLKQLSGNIFGMTVNYAQIATSDFSSALKPDSVLYVYAQIFGFEFTAENPGAGWWMWDGNEVNITKSPSSPDDALFAFVPYTGTKTGAEFYTSDFEEPMFGYDVKGYAAPCVALPTNNHYRLNNPIGEDGRYVVKYDCETGAFAASNDVEVDETFVFAVDVTGTWLADWLLETPTAAGATRGVAINKWTSKGDVSGDTNRMKKISENIFGMTVNYDQIATGDFSSVKKTDSVLYVYGQLFGFEFTAENPGAGWWMWGENPVGITAAPWSPDDALFAFAPYTGTKTGEEFKSSDFEEPMFGYDVKGYAAPCATPSTGVENVSTDAKGHKKMVENGILYVIDSKGVKHSVLGTIVK